MCLYKITKTFTPEEGKEERDAYKLLARSYNLYETPYQWTAVRENIWEVAEEYLVNIADELPSSYTAGFHCYATLKDAEKAARFLVKENSRHKIVKVRIRELLYEGIDATSWSDSYLKAEIKTVVAQQMFVPQYPTGIVSSWSEEKK